MIYEVKKYRENGATDSVLNSHKIATYNCLQNIEGCQPHASWRYGLWWFNVLRRSVAIPVADVIYQSLPPFSLYFLTS